MSPGQAGFKDFYLKKKSSICSIISRKGHNPILFLPLCPPPPQKKKNKNTFSVFTSSEKNLLTLPLETKASKASSICVYIWLVIVLQSHWVPRDNAVFQKLTIKHNWALVITHIWCRAGCNVKAATLYGWIIHL